MGQLYLQEALANVFSGCKVGWCRQNYAQHIFCKQSEWWRSPNWVWGLL